jgi:nucleotide-binding universal stress UspA family protein
MTGRAQTIVVGFDGSDGAKRALERAADLVGYGTSLAVVNVVPPSWQSNGHQLLDEARIRLNARYLTARTLERVGDPTAELLEAARELHADLLVIGDGKKPFDGSVGARLIHEAPCDVLVVR